MSLRNRNGLAVLLRAFLLFLSYFVLKSIFSGFSWRTLLRALAYYPDLSNLCMIAVSAVYLGFGFRTRITGGTRIPRAMQIIRFAVAVSAAFVLLHQGCIFLLTLPHQTEMTLYPFLAYTLIPILFLTDFFAFDRGRPVNRNHVLWTAALPLGYIVCSALYLVENYTAEFFSHYVYYSIIPDLIATDTEGLEIGWHIVWPLLILFGATLALGYLFGFIQRKTIKPEPAGGDADE